MSPVLLCDHSKDTQVLSKCTVALAECRTLHRRAVKRFLQWHAAVQSQDDGCRRQLTLFCDVMIMPDMCRSNCFVYECSSVCTGVRVVG